MTLYLTFSLNAIHRALCDYAATRFGGSSEDYEAARDKAVKALSCSW